VLVSHYDTKSGISPDFAGANDSGSSTGLLLELARVIKSEKKEGPDILLAFVDGEECAVEYGRNDGLHGSKHLAEMLLKKYGNQAIKGVIVMDMIGDRNLNVTIPMNSSHALASLALKAAHEDGQRLKFSLGNEIIDDHVPFIMKGIKAIDLIDFEFGSAPGKNDYWHTTADTIDKLSPESLGIAGRVVIRMINKLSSH
jgi:glutaminyl-peptide cyclotransferase